MTALATAPIIADDVEYYEVRDLLSGEVIGRITAHRVRADGPLRRALEKHGFRFLEERYICGAELIVKAVKVR